MKTEIEIDEDGVSLKPNLGESGRSEFPWALIP
jgi:hypothetical protein